MLGVIALALVSCSKAGSIQLDTRTIQLKTSSDLTKTVYHDNKVQWATQDRLIVFDEAGDKKVTENCGTAYEDYHNFTVTDWPVERTPVYAIFNCSAYNEVYPDASISDEKISAILPQNQIIRNANSFAQHATVSVGAVTSSGEDFNAVLRNVNGILKFQFSDETIQSLEISSVEGVDLAGLINIPVSSVDAGAPAYEVTEGSKSVTLSVTSNAANNGCFKTGAYYMASVLPGTFTPVLTITRKNGSSCVRTASKAVTLERNKMIDLGTIDGDATWKLSMGFTSIASNPFSNIGSTALADGSTFQVKGMEGDFVSLSGAGVYWKSALWFTAAGYIKFPSIAGYALESVTIAGGNSAGKPLKICKNTDGNTASGGDQVYIASADLGTGDGSTAANAKAEHTWNVRNSDEYYLRATSSSIKIIKLVLVYTQVPAVD